MSGRAAADGSAAARIGRYRIAFELASGGMATMFLARAEGPGGFEKLAALKRIHPHLAKDQQFIEMFFDEARIADGELPVDPRNFSARLARVMGRALP